MLSNLDAVLAESHMAPRHVVITTMCLSNLRDVDRFNAVCATHFGTRGAPARVTGAGGPHPRDAKVEIGLVAAQ